MTSEDIFQRFFREMFGSYSRPPETEREENDSFKKPRDPLWDSGGDGNNFRDFNTLFDFKIIRDPFEMHQFVQQKINDVFKIHSFDIFDPPHMPAIEKEQDPRDHYLKSGLNKTPNEKDVVKDHSDMMGPFSSWLETLPGIQHPPSEPHTFSFFKSVIRKSVTLPDGTIKTEEIIRNSDGTEQRTESHTLPDGTNTPNHESLFTNPDISGLFDYKMPEIKVMNPRDQFLKPGYEKFNPFEEKIDKDLDKQILQSGVESLSIFTDEPDMTFKPNQSTTFKSVIRKTITLPNGEVQTEEVIRNADGTEQRTITQTQKMLDGTSSTVSRPDNELIFGSIAPNQQEEHTSVLSFTVKGIKDLIGNLFK